MHMLASEYHIRSWEVLTQLDFGRTYEIWVWLK